MLYQFGLKDRIILCGKGGSGKDHLRKLLEEFGLVYQPPYTTRPIRQNEINGRDYYFIKESEFKDMIRKNCFYEYNIFNNWYYGITKVQFYIKNSIFIMTPSGLKHLSKKDRDRSLVIYLDIADDIRRIRLSNRNDADSVERRINTDNLDFSNFCDYDIYVTNSNFTIDEIIDYVNFYFDIEKNILKHFYRLDL